VGDFLWFWHDKNKIIFFLKLFQNQSNWAQMELSQWVFRKRERERERERQKGKMITLY
jgi:hypothetical protein